MKSSIFDGAAKLNFFLTPAGFLGFSFLRCVLGFVNLNDLTYRLQADVVSNWYLHHFISWAFWAVSLTITFVPALRGVGARSLATCAHGILPRRWVLSQICVTTGASTSRQLRFARFSQRGGFLPARMTYLNCVPAPTPAGKSFRTQRSSTFCINLTQDAAKMTQKERRLKGCDHGTQQLLK